MGFAVKAMFQWSPSKHINIYRFQLRQYTNIPISMSNIPLNKFHLANIPAFLPIPTNTDALSQEGVQQVQFMK